jgi:hypothetical protein
LVNFLPFLLYLLISGCQKMGLIYCSAEAWINAEPDSLNYNIIPGLSGVELNFTSIWDSHRFVLNFQACLCAASEFFSKLTFFFYFILQFENVLNQPDPGEDLRKLVDPRLGEDYPLDSVRKVKKTYHGNKYQDPVFSVRIKAKCLFWSQVTQLAKACTHENPQMRPSMRSIVVALMTLSSSTEDWDVGSFYENKALVNLMSGR